MAPSKKVVESQSGSADILSHRPSLDDEAFVEQLLRVAQCVSNGTTITATTMAAASVSFDEIYPTIVKRLTTTNTVVQPVHGSNSSLANSLETSTLGQTNGGVAAAAGSKTPPTVVQVIAPPSSQDGSVVAPSVENVSFSCGGGGGNELANASFSRNALAADEVTTSQETIVLHLTSLLARALNAEDYWTNLLHQIRVDHYVWAIRYCASHGFSALKTLHLLQWLRSFQGLVEQRAHGCRGTKEEHNNKEQHGGAEMNNNNNNSVTRMEVVEETTGTAGRVNPTNITTNGATGRRNSATSNTSQAGRTNATRKSGASNGRRSRLGGRRESDTTTAIAAAAAAFTPPSPHRPFSKDNNAESNAAESGVEGASHVSYEARLYAAMKDFLLSELQEGWRWEQAARDLAQGRDLSLVNAGANTGAEEGGGTPVTGNLATTPPPSSSSPQSTSRKAPRGEKARQQQLEEQEEEQRRQALLAALPRENIYLTRDEVVPFCAFFLTKGMLAHTALYRYVAHHDRPSQPAIRLDETPNTTTIITTTVKDKQESHVDRVFHVSVEVPMSVPPLAASVLRELNTTTIIAGDSVTNKTANTGTTAATAAAAANEGSARAAGHGSNNNSNKAGKGVATQRAEKGRTGESPSRRSPRGSGTTTVTVTTTTSTTSLPEKPEEHMSHHSPGSPRHTNAAPLQSNAASPLAALRAMQAEEEDRLTREHHAAEAAAALAATIAKREAEMQLHFAQEGTQRAVQDVYTSLEEDVTRRQMRVLQRVEALEKTLGITTITTNTIIGGSNETGGNVSGEAGGSTEAAAGGGANKAKRPPPTTQKKAKR